MSNLVKGLRCGPVVLGLGTIMAVTDPSYGGPMVSEAHHLGLLARDLAAIASKADLVAVAAEYLPVRLVGERRWIAPCPTRPDGYEVLALNEDRGVFYCFGCGARGDVVTFVQMVEAVTFSQAAEALAQYAGIRVQVPSSGDGHGHEVCGRA